MNPNPNHCAECGALHRLKESLERIDLAKDPTIDRDMTANLLMWFKFVGEAETTLRDFLGYAEAIGCEAEERLYENPDQPKFPKVTVAGLNRKFATLQTADRSEFKSVVEACIDQSVKRLIGTYQDRALRAFGNLYRPQKETQS